MVRIYDQMVYKLYGLTAEEIAIVEESAEQCMNIKVMKSKGIKDNNRDFSVVFSYINILECLIIS